MAGLYPLRFHPLFKHAIWGGRRLGTRLGKDLPPGDDYSESWEVADHGEDQSRVAAGPLAGTTLGELVREHGRDLLGRHHPQDRFPLLFKFLDCNRKLSVQVHPDDEAAARLDPPDLGKTEAWVVIDAEPGAALYVGFKRGFDRATVERELARGTLELCLHQIQPAPGDCVFVPAGLVHALGGGLLVAEIQQSSDTTFRLYDWNRLGPDGNPRPLHVEQALEVIDWQHGPGGTCRPRPAPGAERLVECDKFLLDRFRLDQPVPLGGDDRFHILAVLDGSLEISGDPTAAPLRTGDTLLLPASCGEVSLTPGGAATFLDAYLP